MAVLAAAGAFCFLYGGTQPIIIIKIGRTTDDHNLDIFFDFFVLFQGMQVSYHCSFKLFIISKKQMTEKKDTISKTIEIYRSKGYKYNTNDLYKFIRKHINSPDDTLDLIIEQVASRQDGDVQYTQDQLRMYLHLIAAVHGGVDVRGRGLKQFMGYTKIKFKSSKNKKQSNQVVDSGQNKEKKSEIKQDKQQEEKKVQFKEEKEETKPKSKSKKKKSKSKKKAQRVEEAINDSQEQSKSPPNQPKEQIKAVPRQVQKQQKPKKQDQPSPPLPPLQPPRPQPKKQSSSSSKQQKQKLLTIEQNTVEEDRTSNVIRPSNSEQFFAKFPEVQLMKMRTTSSKPVQIRGFDKFGQNYLNPIIKFRIIYKEKSIYRRYSEFDNLMKYLNKKFQGFILPQLPPKEGIKSNLSYFWGLDQGFLNERQIKLQEMMNVLMNSKFISEDEVLNKFLTDQEFEVESGQTIGTLNYIRSLGQIAFNAKQLKTYGMAYYNYFKSFKKTDINNNVTECYKKAQPVLSYCLEVQNYRLSIISNFDKRRQIFAELQQDKDDRTLTITQFDKMSSASAAEVRNLQKQMNKYYELKSQQSWLSYLINQKEQQRDITVQEIKSQHKKIEARIANMQGNLIDSIDTLVRSKTAFIEEIGKMMIQWRRSIHP